MIGVQLAQQLKDAGLGWKPAAGDRFAIPDRDLDDEVFVLSTMTIEVYDVPNGPVIGFNGTTEWALDDIERDEAIWLPREDQLRAMLGAAFQLLSRDGDGYLVGVRGQPDACAATPEDAYGVAVLNLLRAGFTNSEGPAGGS